MGNYEFWKKFKIEDRLVKEFEYWFVVVRGKQVTLGACVFLLKRDASSLGELTSQEAEEFVQIVSWYENRLKSVYNAERFNYVVAMMKDPYVHYHAFPRYSSEQNLYGLTWKDEDWPRVVEFKKIDTEEKTLFAIRDALRE